jgi:CheY-like chemotaxis protein
VITIVLVDDEYDMLSAIKEVLEDEGYSVMAFSSGREALDAITSQAPDMVLMDVMMPFMSGPEVLERMRKLPGMASVPVVMMSAVDPPKANAVYQAFLKKPFTLERLTKVVGAALGGRQ